MLQTTRTNDPMSITGSISLNEVRLGLIFTADATPETMEKFYKIFSNQAWNAMKESEQFALLASVVAQIEGVENATALNVTAGDPVLKE